MASIGIALFAATMGSSTRAWAGEGPCATSLRTVTCDPLPFDVEERHATLRELDAAAREAITEQRPAAAARLFECLLLADPRPEHAGNLSVALKQLGDLPAALSAAACAERLTPPDSPAMAWARARREDLERLISGPGGMAQGILGAQISPLASDVAAPPGPGLGSPVIAPPAPSTPSVPALSSSPAAPSPSPGHHRRLTKGTTAALVGAALLTGGAAASYLAARNRADQFNQEQDRNGASPLAESLRSSAERWQAISLSGFIAAGAAALIAFALR